MSHDSDEQAAIIAGLFFVMSVRLQAAAQLAEEGQSLSLLPGTKLDLARRLHASAREIAILADATAALIENLE